MKQTQKSLIQSCSEQRKLSFLKLLLSLFLSHGYRQDLDDGMVPHITKKMGGVPTSLHSTEYALESHNQSQQAKFSLKEHKQALVNYPFDAKDWQTEALPL